MASCPTRSLWTTGNTGILGPFLAVIFASMIALGLWFDRQAFKGVGQLLRLSGQAQTDFIAVAGIGPTLVNMALSGIVGMTYILLVGGDLNGPVVGALLSIVGFAAFGKHPGTSPGHDPGCSCIRGQALDPAGPMLLLAALFGTTLAPIAGRFGWHWGIVAGFIHASAVQTVGQLHAGLNLYNNGFAAGIVASVLVPVIIAINRAPSPTGCLQVSREWRRQRWRKRPRKPPRIGRRRRGVEQPSITHTKTQGPYSDGGAASSIGRALETGMPDQRRLSSPEWARRQGQSPVARCQLGGPFFDLAFAAGIIAITGSYAYNHTVVGGIWFLTVYAVLGAPGC